MRPRVCPSCTSALGRETRHKASRLCAQVQAERRRETNPDRKAYHAKRMKRIRKDARDAS
jgi:hypothetical protein